MNEAEARRPGRTSDSAADHHHAAPSHVDQGHHRDHGAHHPSPELDGLTPLEFWEARYADEERVWSGQVNVSLADTVAELTPGRSVDLGCGEGADVLWLAERGWRATGLDISPTAIGRARKEAAARGLTAEQVDFVVADLSAWRADAIYDLVSASFLHSPAPLARVAILQRAAAAVRPGGHLLVISHAAPADPDEVAHPHVDLHHHPEDQYRELELDDSEWTLTQAGRRNRPGRKPTGEPVEVEDLIVLVRRG
jgi:SAM-dependent methyltransferase